jgi:hypothetical protein
MGVAPSQIIRSRLHLPTPPYFISHWFVLDLSINASVSHKNSAVRFALSVLTHECNAVIAM